MQLTFAVDHIVLGVRDSTAGVELVSERTGVRPKPAVVAPVPSSPTMSRGIHLGGESYFEIYAPNPEYQGPPSPIRDLLSTLEEPRLVAWFVRVRNLDATMQALARSGQPLTKLFDVVRTDSPSYQNAFFTTAPFDPSVPMLIEWRDRLGMDAQLAPGCTLEELWVTSPEPARTRSIHALLGLDVRIEPDTASAARVRLATPRGSVLF